MFRRLLVRVSASEKFVADGKERDKDEKPQPPPAGEGDAAGSVGLDRMVLSFMEDAATVERPPRGRCNCFNGSNHEESDDEEFDFLPSEHASAPVAAGAGDALEALKVRNFWRGEGEPPRIRGEKLQFFPFQPHMDRNDEGGFVFFARDSWQGLVQSASLAERNLLADASRIADKCSKSCKGKAEYRRSVADGLRTLGYDAAVCKSRWEKTPSYPAGICRRPVV